MIFAIEESEISLPSSIQVLYFYTTWMPFHNKMLHVLSQLEDQYKIEILAIDIGHFINQCIRFSINSVPTLLILKNGKEINRVEGTVKKHSFVDVLADICIS